MSTRIVFLVRELDLSSTGQLRATLDRALDASDDVRVDLSGLRAVDSTAIRELLRAQALAAQTGKAFCVVAPTASVRRLLDAADAAGLIVDGRGDDPDVSRITCPA